jgi:CheY-like chemotaxis protein
MLDLSKIEAGKLELHVQPFDLEEVIGLAVGVHASLSAQNGSSFSVEIDPEVRGAWRGDGVKLGQVLSNLLSNAVKFTPRGVVSLRIAPGLEGLSFEVADTGVGIPADKLELIFDSFTQVDTSTTRRYGGAGLGLSICRRLVALMGGDLKVTSREGAGSTFFFSLPLSRSEDPIAQQEASVADIDAGDETLRLLAAEDNPTNQLVLKALLEPLGVELTIVGDGRQAVEAHVAHPFDLILMDIQMPEMNGVDATVEIRRLEREGRAPRTPIVALTANVMRHQIDTYLEAGMDGVVAKPVELSVLLEAIQSALSPPHMAVAAVG